LADDIQYSFRAGIFGPERHFSLKPSALEWRAGGRTTRVAYHEISRITVFKRRFFGSSATYWTCILTTRAGRRIRLGAASRAGLGIVDRSVTYFPFIKELEARIASANPDSRLVTGRHWLTRIEAVVGVGAVGFLRALRHLDLAKSSNAAAWLMRGVGPRLRGHRTAAGQIALALPELSHAEHARILIGMWDNLARTLVEYAHLERILGPVRASTGGRLVLHERMVEALESAPDVNLPILVFSAHLANWELLAPAAVWRRRGVALVYRKLPIAPLDDELTAIRSKLVTRVIPAGLGTALEVRAALRSNLVVGMLVDQHYADGIEVTFFGRTCRVNPLLARFARLFDCSVRGARIIRLRDGNFLYDITEPLDLPRDRDGRVDVAGSMQMITSIIEQWVREHPDQWMWLHKRWR
jgi:Kdo2-lipid IVA lauroyltransferase/acyltransferase